ncbi:hypothetical protein [Blastococcus tunisiensis]|uniref:Uncharacterized protein n=1 Tax=Blastococcus tunisiensis TaxID=1798228 RepID=A0A1I2I5Y4_9ACTN|nr:hypothetical protein [Blastococcus sp. DSM 46838]SFF35911.1 hypothetical protein SAMN05216574_11249 [Blastococcus sp. DSM 46838]
MTDDVIARDDEATIRAMLVASGGKPVIQIVFDPEVDTTSIQSVGFEHAKIPNFIYTLGRVLVGEI